MQIRRQMYIQTLRLTSGKCANASCNLWHPPVCCNYKSESGCPCGDKRRFRHVEADKRPSTKSKKSGGKGSVSLLKESGKFGSNHTVKFYKGTFHHITSFGKEGVHREGLCKSMNLKSVVLARRNSRIEPHNKNDAPAGKHGTCRKMSKSSKQGTRPRFYSPTEALEMSAPSSKKRGSENLQSTQEDRCTC